MFYKSDSIVPVFIFAHLCKNPRGIYLSVSTESGVFEIAFNKLP